MTFSQARLLSKVNALHIRRDSWAADKWFMLWRGTWFVFGTAVIKPKPVSATDYTRNDLLATDWTTVPAALTSCPVTPTEPGGGGPPGPGFPGFPLPSPGGGTPTFPPPPGGSPDPGPDPFGPPPLPPAASGTGLSIEFEGLINEGGLGDFMHGVTADDLNGQHDLAFAGAGVWKKKFIKGFYNESGDDEAHADHHFEWTITASRFDSGGGTVKWHLSMSSIGVPGGASPSGGFAEITPMRRFEDMHNVNLDSTFGAFHGGTGTIL